MINEIAQHKNTVMKYMFYNQNKKHSPAARVVYISLVFSTARRVLSLCNTRLRLLYLLNIYIYIYIIIIIRLPTLLNSAQYT